MAELF